MAPVYHALSRIGKIDVKVLLSGQHRDQLSQALRIFNVNVTLNLDVMTESQTLPGLVSTLFARVAETLSEWDTDYVLVHGDTITTVIVAWAAFLENIPIGHVEAGLRSHDIREPFPEEANRRLTDVLADLYLAPTALSFDNLVAEGVSAERIIITGQTGIDALNFAIKHTRAIPNVPTKDPLVLITLHRRENWPILAEIVHSISSVAKEFPDHIFVCPVHRNPSVREIITKAFSDIPNILLFDILDYGQMTWLLTRTRLIVTDSGGLQEEGAALDIPVLVIRNVTERPEGCRSGILTVVGTSTKRIASEIRNVLSTPDIRKRTGVIANPFGDGHASDRVASAVAWRLGLQSERPSDWLFEGSIYPDAKSDDQG